MKNKLRIGFFIDTFYPMIDGVISVVDTYARNLCKTCDVTVFAPVGRKPFDDSSLPYKVVRCNKKFLIFFLDYDLPLPKKDKEFLKILENTKLDIVHIHSPFSMGKIGIEYAKKHGVPCVATLHTQYKHDFKIVVKSNIVSTLMVKKIIKVLNQCDECWAVNDGVVKIFRDDYHLKTPITVHYNATNMLPKDFSKAELEDFDKNFEIEKNQHVFCFVGRLTKIKNIMFIADSLKIAKDEGLNFKTIFVGSGVDEKALKRKIKKLGLEKNCFFTGRVTDKTLIEKVYARSELLLFPSYGDTDGLVKYEAACFGMPTVSIKNLCSSSNIEDNVTGFLSENSPKSYAQKLIEVCNNRELFEKVSQNCKKLLYRTWQNSIQKAFESYLNLVQEK